MVMVNLIPTSTSWGNITFIHLFKGFFDHIISDLNDGSTITAGRFDY